MNRFRFDKYKIILYLCKDTDYFILIDTDEDKRYNKFLA